MFYLIAVGFILLNVFFMVKEESLAMNVLPFILIVGLLAIYAFDKLIYLIVFFSPLSIELSYFRPGIGINMYLPTEPLLFGVLIIFVLKLIHEQRFDRKILFHPVSIAIYINLFWLLVTSLTSSMPIVSFKFLLARMWFLVAFYFLMTKLFLDRKIFDRFVWLYLFGFFIVIFYAIIRHSGYGLLNKHAAHFVSTPFFHDHTSYGAALAMFLPFVALFSLSRHYSFKIRFFSSFAFLLIFVAFILSYSRAAWLGMMVGVAVLVIMKLRIRFVTIAITAIVVIGLVFSFQHEIVYFLEKNSGESSSNLTEHFTSMGNISSDASNLERINRWKSAVFMFEERPVFGYGPGTYMFQYAKYQLRQDRTIISTNAGDAGNAHSEYLGPLAESGVGGLLTFLLIIITVLYTGIKTWSRVQDAQFKGFILAAVIGLITYYVHGFLNNFLDTDKLSAPFWGFTAIIVAIDILSKAEFQHSAK